MTLAQGRMRRLPVYFIIDDSAAMQGTLQVALVEGLQTLQRHLLHHPLAVSSVYLSTLYFGETIQFQRPQPLSRFALVPMGARGTRPLQKALVHAQESWRYDLIAPDSQGNGDARPLAFEVLGDVPDDDWHTTHTALRAQTDLRLPYLITLLVQQSQRDRFAPLPQSLLLALEQPTGAHLAHYFAWVTETIVQVNALVQGGATGIDLPALPTHSLSAITRP